MSQLLLDSLSLAVAKKSLTKSCLVFFYPADRVGGRTLSTEIPAANGVERWDFGGQWVGR